MNRDSENGRSNPRGLKGGNGAILAALNAALAPTAPSRDRLGPPALTVVAESDSMIWNAVAVDRGRVLLGGPRWSGSKPPLAKLDEHGLPIPFPDDSWNAWSNGDDPGQAFVNVNAIHRDGEGQLWAVDTGSPVFGGDPLPGGAKVVCIDLETDSVTRVYPLGPDVAQNGSYVDDIRINGGNGYLTDAGRPGIIVLDLKSGGARRVLDGDRPATAPDDRPIIVDGATVFAPDGSRLKVHSDPLEISPDGRWFYFGPLEGPWVRIETRYLDDPSLPADELSTRVEPWADLPPIGGSVMDTNGDLYFTDLAECALKRLSGDGTVTTIVRDSDLHWVDAPFIDDRGGIWLPVPQMDRAALFHGGKSEIKWPVRLYHYPLR